MKKYILIIFMLFSTIMLQAQCTENGNYWNQSWVSCEVSSNPNPLRGNASHWLLYEFHEAHYIDASHVWNANRVGESGWGAKDVWIDYSVDGNTWIAFGQMTFPKASESADYAGFQGPNFQGVFIKKILLTILSTHDGGTCASIAEMQFKIDQNACFGVLDACGICDGPGQMTWYRDADGDGLGDATNTMATCTQPTGYVADNTDSCDNGNLGWSDVAPLFTENGCTGCHGAAAASGLDLRSYATISAGGNICGTSLLTGNKLVDIINISGYSGCDRPISVPSMNARVGNQLDAQEVAKIQAWVDGGAPELCTDFCVNAQTEIPYNGIDDDCNPLTLDDDLDQDGFVKAVDCNDGDASINPNAEDIPNNDIDENCDGNLCDAYSTSSIALSDAHETDKDYSSTLSIESSATIGSGIKVNYYANQSIKLKTGFHAAAGSVFSAIITDCTTQSLQALAIDRTIGANNSQAVKSDENILVSRIYPNPFREVVHIEYTLKEATTLQITVNDLTGKRIATVVEPAYQEAGDYVVQWKRESNFTSGMLLLTIQTDQTIIGKKIVLAYNNGLGRF